MLNVITGLLSNGVIASNTAFESIATVNVGSGGSSSITFSSIPSTYTHLQVRGIYKGTTGTGEDYWSQYFYLNGDTGSNYAYHYLQTRNTAVSAGAASSQSYTGNYFAEIPNAFASSLFGTFVMDILDYKNTNKNKTIRSLSGYNNTDTSFVKLNSNLWTSTSAITSITFTPQTAGGNYAQYSSFALYGVK